MSRLCSRRSFIGAILIAFALARPLAAQSRVSERFVALAVLVQSSPTTVESGLQVSAGGRIPVAPGLALSPSVELARTGAMSTGDGCELLPGTTTCFERPSSETLAGLGLAIVIAPPHAASWHPRATLGVGWLHSFGDAVAGERRQFLTPEVSLGVARHAWGVDLRLRRLHRWRSAAQAQLALQLLRTF